jgi:hypothetical protein
MVSQLIKTVISDCQDLHFISSPLVLFVLLFLFHIPPSLLSVIMQESYQYRQLNLFILITHFCRSSPVFVSSFLFLDIRFGTLLVTSQSLFQDSFVCHCTVLFLYCWYFISFLMALFILYSLLVLPVTSVKQLQTVNDYLQFKC